MLAAGGALSHHHGVGLNRARFVADALGAGFDVLHRGEGRARPERHPQPGQARPAQPVRRAPLAVSTHDRVLVLDVGTSSVRAAVVRADGTHRARSRARAAPRLAGRRPRAVRRDRDGARRPSTSPPPRSTRRVPSTRSASPISAASTIVWDRATGEPVGPGLGWQDLRTVGECLALRGDGLRVGPNQSATKVQWLLDQLRPRPRPRPLLRHRRHVDRVDALGRRACTSPTRRTPRSPGCSARAITPDWEPKTLDQLGIPERLMPAIVDSAGVVGAGDRAPRRAADRGPRSATSRRRSSGRAACTAATPRSRSAPAACSTSCSATTPPAFAERGKHGTFPIVAWRARRPAHVGHRGDHARGGHERAVAARRPRAHRLQRESHDLAASCPTPAASCSSRRRSASARRRGTTARAARCSG